MYSTLVEYKAYATAKGITLTKADAALTVDLINACAYIDSKEERLKGIRAARDQDNAYPRANLVLNGYPYLSSEIPDLVKNCEMELALELNDGIDLYEIPVNLPVIKERVEGAVEVGYATPSRVETKERNSVALSMLNQLMVSRSISIPLVRV